MKKSVGRRLLIILSASMLFAGFACLTQAQISQTGAGKGTSAVSGGTVAVDQIGGGRSSPTTTSYSGNPLTITGGLTDSALALMLMQCNGAGIITGIAINWDASGTPQTVNPIGSPASSLTAAVFMYGLRSPTSGTPVLSISWTGSAQVAFGIVSFSGVNQTNDAAAFKNFNSTTNAAPIDLSISSATGHKVVAGFASAANFSSVSGTQVTLDNACNIWATASNWDAGAGTVHMIGNPGSAVTSVAAGMDISP